MDFGYDEFGNRTHNPEEDAEVRSISSGSARNVGTENGAYATHALGGAHGSDDDNDSHSDSDSDFSDDVELVVGETATQSISKPLVESAYISSGGATRTANDGLFLVEDVHANGRGPTLLIEEAKGTTDVFTAVASSAPPSASPSATYLQMISRLPQRTRNVALVGALHHGKTSVLDMLLYDDSARGNSSGDGAAVINPPCAAPAGYRRRQDELDREMTLKSHVVTHVMGGARLHQTSHAVTFVDTPGHPDFIDEVAAGLRLADAVLFCVDAVESLSVAGEAFLRQAVLRENLPIVLVITKVDRLIADLKLPVTDAYRKLRMVIDVVNNVIASCTSLREHQPESSTIRGKLVSPLNGTVCFTSAKLGFFFTLESFALKYADAYPSVSYTALAQKLWGQITLDAGKFKKITTHRQRPTFVTLILEPLYKIIAHAVTGTGHTTLSSALKPLPRSPLSAIREAVRHFCGDPAGEGADALLAVLPGTMGHCKWLEEHYQLYHCYGENRDNEKYNKNSEEVQAAITAARSTATVTAIAPLLRVFASNGEVAAVTKVVRGTLKTGSALVVVDDHASEVDPFYELRATALYIRSAKDGYVRVQSALAGQVVYVTGIPQRAGSHLVLVGGAAAATVRVELEEETAGDGTVDEMDGEWLDAVLAYPFETQAPLVHVSLELKDPERFDSLRHGLQTIMRTTPGLDVHTEETGEFTLTGAGEMHLDTALHELRRGLCAGVRIGLSQPFVSFSETVMDEEGVLAVAGTRKAGVGCVAGVLSRAFTNAVEYGTLDFFPSPHGGEGCIKLWTTMQREYGFDELDARNVMALGPNKTKGPSVLFNDTLPEELELCGGTIATSHRAALAAGFRASVTSGPLIGGVVRGVGVRLIFADMETGTREAVVLANMRTSVRHALLGARPRLLEPVLAAEILCLPESLEAITDILRQRRGAVVGEQPIAATTLTRVQALVPTMDSFGLETQLRMLTHGEAFPSFSFAQWDVVPGDPFDASVRVAPMEPAKGYQLARDFVLKTRFRKGLPLNLAVDL